MTADHSTKTPIALFGGEASMPGLSVVTPMYNEAGGAGHLIEEIAQTIKSIEGIKCEIIIVDDGSTDETRAAVLEKRDQLAQSVPPVSIRLLRHDGNAGQSRAIRTGVLGAKYDMIAMLDGDGQNNPVDIPAMYSILKGGGVNLAMVAGERQKRLDSGSKRAASKYANFIRQKLLNDGAHDSGCGLKLFWREAFLRLPYFDHLHRYLPFMIQREGLEVVFHPVGHRVRTYGASKYTNMGRLVVAFRDLLGVIWLKSRAKSPGRVREE